MALLTEGHPHQKERNRMSRRSRTTRFVQWVCQITGGHIPVSSEWTGNIWCTNCGKEIVTIVPLPEDEE